MTARRVSIVIVNWNSGDQLARCLHSIALFGGEHVDKVVVVDNHSTDQSLTSVMAHSSVTAIKLEENAGFARACNIGARNLSADFILFLNPDAALLDGAIGAVLDFLDTPKNSDVGICGVQLIDEQESVWRSCARFPTPMRLVSLATGADRIFPIIGTTMGEWDHRQSRRVDQVIGAFFLVRSDLFRSLGGFDERFFVYFEEVDFAFRASRRGMGTMFLADIKAFHAGGGTSGQVKARRLFYSLRSRILYARKHFSRMGYFLVIVTAFGLEPVARSVNHLVRGQLVGVRETLVAYRMLFDWVRGVEK